jgi:hypothetical protein
MMVVGGAVLSAAAVTAGAVLAQADGTKAGAAALSGGLAIENGTVQRQAAAGAANVVKVSNNSKQALSVAVTARPWSQSSTGFASPNRRSVLRNVGVSDDSFTLAPGASRDVTVTLKSVPGAGYQYGALEVVGLPTNVAKRKGLITGYRLVGALRYTAATPRYSLKPGSAKIKGGQLVLNVKSSGNTADPVSGSVRVKGPLGTKQSSIKGVRVLPGKTISLALMSAKKLRPGSYKASVSLKQGTFKTSVSRRVRVKR